MRRSQRADDQRTTAALTNSTRSEGVDADRVRKVIYDRFDMSFGMGLGKMKVRMFRIGHLGDCNDLMLIATLGGCEMGLQIAGVPLAASGLPVAMAYLASESKERTLKHAA